MARDFAKDFYNSGKWRKCSKAFAASKFYMCEKCGRPAKHYIVHHIKPLDQNNIGNPEITMSWDNLMLLCHACHQAIHGRQETAVFDEYGDMIYKPPGDKTG